MTKYFLLIVLLGSTNAKPQPDAAPDAEPNMNNYGAPVISSNPYGGSIAK